MKKYEKKVKKLVDKYDLQIEGSDSIKDSFMIQTIDLHKIYNITEGIEVRALNGVSMEVKKGEFVSVMGPSGSGKTTLLNMIGALDNPSSGVVKINGINIAKMNDRERTNLRLKEIGFIFQFYNLVPVLTAYENVDLPMIFAGKSKYERERNVNRFIDLVGLSEMKEHIPSELSGGEQQRVAIARALCNEPSILIVFSLFQSYRPG